MIFKILIKKNYNVFLNGFGFFAGSDPDSKPLNHAIEEVIRIEQKRILFFYPWPLSLYAALTRHITFSL